MQTSGTILFVFAMLVSVAVSAPVSGWFAGSGGQSCTNACSGKDPCRTGPMNAVVNAAQVTDVMASIGLTCVTVSGTNSDTAPRIYTPTGQCHYDSVGTTPADCENTFGLPGSYQRACCCGTSDADCPIPSPAPVSSAPISSSPTTVPTAAPTSHVVNCKGDRDFCRLSPNCVWVGDWGRGEYRSQISWIRRRIKSRPKMQKKIKRKLQRRLFGLRAEITACTGLGGCQYKGSECAKYCRSVCNVVDNCMWKTGGEGCVGKLF